MKIYRPLPDGMYQRIDVHYPDPYLKDGWFLSIDAHKKSLEKPVAKSVKPSKKQAEVNDDGVDQATIY